MELPLNGWGADRNPAFSVAFTRCKCGARYERNGETGKIYYQTCLGQERSGIRCVDCNSKVLAVKRTHSLWDGPFPLSDAVLVASVQIPYCPHCEETPRSRGSPINPRD